jgi:hypothetical protein
MLKTLSPLRCIQKYIETAFNPPSPLKKGSQILEVPLFKGDLGGLQLSNAVQSKIAYTNAVGEASLAKNFSSSVRASASTLVCIGQNFGPHMEQNSAVL